MRRKLQKQDICATPYRTSSAFETILCAAKPRFIRTYPPASSGVWFSVMQVEGLPSPRTLY
jgi:hypothetical protein